MKILEKAAQKAKNRLKWKKAAGIKLKKESMPKIVEETVKEKKLLKGSML